MVDEPREPDGLEEATPPRVSVAVPDLPEWRKPHWLPSVENLVIEAAKRFKNRFRYVRVLGQWFVYEDGVWSWDERDQLNGELGELTREIGAAMKRTVRMKLENGAIVSTIERRLRPELAATSEQWDRDAMLVNTLWRAGSGRVVEMVPRRPEDYCTKQTAVAPDREMAIPMWRAHLQFVTGGDAELIEYLQRACGYSATGLTTEQCLFVLHGTGANGKGVFLRTVAGVLGSYAASTAMETFAANQHDRHPEELARLRGVRMVVASETEQGRAWNEARIKQLTGGDKIVARFMRENSFEFEPAFKIWLMTNHKPAIHSPDHAIARRLHMIPFNQQISDDDKNLQLFEQMKAEWPGILAWVLDGLSMWRDGGLQPPAAVIAATSEYIADEDVLAAWIEEECDLLPDAETLSSQLYASWKKWAEARGERVGSNKMLSQRLDTKGFRKRHSRSGAAYRGIALRAYVEEGQQGWLR